MQEIKIRYVVENIQHNISMCEFTLEDIELGAVQDWIKTLPGNGNKIIFKDLFTGKQDKNGKDIYANDISDKGLIIWSAEYLGFFVKLRNGESIPLYDENNLEIIGNIHQNP